MIDANVPDPPTTLIVDSDRPCATCGYNLRTLAEDGVCPECNSRISDSLTVPGFNLAAGDAARVVRALKYVVVAAFIHALGLLQALLVFRISLQLEQWGLRWLVRVSFQGWCLSFYVGLMLATLAVAQIHRRYGRLGIGTRIALGMGYLGAGTGVVLLICSWVSTQLFPQPLWGVAGYLAYAGQAPLIAMLVIALWRRIDRRANAALWCVWSGAAVYMLYFCAISCFALVLEMLDSTERWLGVPFAGTTGPFSSTIQGLRSLRSSPGFWQVNPRYFFEGRGYEFGFLVMLAPLWLYIRRLRAACRSQ